MGEGSRCKEKGGEGVKAISAEWSGFLLHGFRGHGAVHGTASSIVCVLCEGGHESAAVGRLTKKVNQEEPPDGPVVCSTEEPVVSIQARAIERRSKLRWQPSANDNGQASRPSIKA